MANETIVPIPQNYDGPDWQKNTNVQSGNINVSNGSIYVTNSQIPAMIQNTHVGTSEAFYFGSYEKQYNASDTDFIIDTGFLSLSIPQVAICNCIRVSAYIVGGSSSAMKVTGIIPAMKAGGNDNMFALLQGDPPKSDFFPVPQDYMHFKDSEAGYSSNYEDFFSNGDKVFNAVRVWVDDDNQYHSSDGYYRIDVWGFHGVFPGHPYGDTTSMANGNLVTHRFDWLDPTGNVESTPIGYAVEDIYISVTFELPPNVECNAGFASVAVTLNGNTIEMIYSDYHPSTPNTAHMCVVRHIHLPQYSFGPKVGFVNLSRVHYITVSMLSPNIDY